MFFFFLSTEMASHTNKRFLMNSLFFIISFLLLISTALKLFAILVVVRCIISICDCFTATGDDKEEDSSWEDSTSSENDEGQTTIKEEYYRETLRKRWRRSADM